MTCDDAQSLLDAHHAGVLAGGQAAELAAHLGGCAACRADLDALRAVRQAAAGLEREIAPSSDLWRGIAPRLVGRPSRAVPIWLAAAAAVFLMIASSAATWWITRANAPTAMVPARQETDFVRTAAELTEAYLRTRGDMAPETRAVLERNLAVIERALEEARQALRQDPNDRTLEQIVISAYRRKIAFLERATALDRGA